MTVLTVPDSRAEKLLSQIERHLRSIECATVPPANPNGTEIDIFFTNWLPFCVDGLQYFEAEGYQHDNIANVTTFLGRQYKNTSLGVITSVPPVGVVNDGYCHTGGTCVTCRTI